MQSEGVQFSTASDGLPLPTRFVAFDQEPTSGMQPVRLVIISDTHGFEQSMTNLSATASTAAAVGPVAGDAAAVAALPSGDVLVHCGDFAPGPVWPDGKHVGPDEAQASFDAWLAAQPHPLKVVVRGNHDPRHARFPRSGAVYATSPRSLELEVRGRPLRLALVPFDRQPRGKNAAKRRKSASRSFALPAGEVLISHVPPRGVLDRCSSGDLGGCAVLRASVERAGEKPRLWLCGHIHEGRGAIRHRFEPPGAGALLRVRERVRGGSGGGASGTGDGMVGAAEPGTTVVVNAASANSGMARQLLHGATVVTLMI